RMQPPAAEIKGMWGVAANRPRPAAEPVSRFHQEAIDPSVMEPPRCGDAGGATADHHDFSLARWHCRIPRPIALTLHCEARNQEYSLCERSPAFRASIRRWARYLGGSTDGNF